MTGDSLSLAALIFLAAVLYSSVGHAGASGYLAAMAFMGLTPGRSCHAFIVPSPDSRRTQQSCR